MPFLILIILTGCLKNSVKIVRIDSFCDIKFSSIKSEGLLKKDRVNLDAIYINKDYRITLKKFIRPLTINEKEYKECQNSTIK